MRYKIIGLFFGIFISFGANAQTNGNSPYSRYGIGDLVDENFMHTKAMGSIGSSYLDGYHINIVNPASYAFLRATAFDLGMEARRSILSSGDLKAKSWNGNLRYLSLAFPLGNSINDLLEKKKKPYDLGMAFTLMPNSTVGYNILSEENSDGVGDYLRNYSGSGGSYKFLWGNAIKYKEFAFGLNLGYLFGKIRYEQNIDFLDLEFPYQNRFSTEYSLNGFLWGLGAIYSKTLNSKELEAKTARVPKLLSIGVRMKSATNFNTNLTRAQFGVQTISSTRQYIDTISLVDNVKGKGKLPVEYGIGASYYGGEKFMIGFDFSRTNWASYNNDADNTLAENPLLNTFSVSTGGFYRPDYKSYNQYFKRVYYRYGVYYKTDPRQINDVQIKSYGLTMGLGLPFIYQRKISHANIGFEIGKKGGGTPITETYYQISLGFTFNDDEWFIKRKYD